MDASVLMTPAADTVADKDNEPLNLDFLLNDAGVILA